MRVAYRARRVMAGVAALALCVTLGLHVEGCTAVGYAIGARADSRAGNGGPELLMKVKPGRPVWLFLRDGRKLEGRFSGWSRDSAAVSSAAGSPPLPGESVKLATRSGEVTVHAHEIERVSITVSSGKVAGLAIGAAADALAVALTVVFISGMVNSMSW